MTIYLTIITTVLVATQIIRITQNTIQLKRQAKQIDMEIGNLKGYGDIDSYAELQRKVFEMLYARLRGDDNE